MSGFRAFDIGDGRYVDHYRALGFGHLKGVFDATEVRSIRNACLDVWARHQGQTGDLLSYPELRHLALDDRLLHVARALLGKRLVYFGESSLAVDLRRDRVLHRDAKDDPADPSTTSYPIIRFGIYLQDHAHHSDGLKLCPRSHKRVLWTLRNLARLAVPIGREGRLRLSSFRPSWFYNVPTEPGDVVFWNLRTHHSGHAVRLKALPNVALPPRVENLLPDALQAPLERERCAVFMSMGAPSDELNRYILERATTVYNRDFWPRCGFGTLEVREFCEKKGVELRLDGLRFNS